MSSLHVAVGKTHVLEGGSYQFESITLDNGANLVVRGAINLTVRELVTSGDTRIQYEMGSLTATNVPRELNLNVIRGAQITGIFRVIGSGADGGPGANGRGGRNGKNAGHRMRLDVIPPKAESWNCKRGEDGEDGERGDHGEDALSIRLSLFEVNPESRIAIEANGGDGGEGGDGGSGGRGGNGREFQNGCRGGDGGAAGRGGNGGHAGNITAQIVFPDDISADQREAFQEFLDANVIALPGRGGLGGASGAPGGGGGGGGAGGIRIRVGDTVVVDTEHEAGRHGDDGSLAEELRGRNGQSGATEKRLRDWATYRREIDSSFPIRD
jgi:hypothetical protein